MARAEPTLSADTGAGAAVVELLARHRDLLRAYLRVQVGARADLDDLEQEVCVAIWREAAAFDHGRSFAAWMLGFARIHVLRWRDRCGRDRRLVALDETAHDSLVWAGERLLAEGGAGDDLRRCLDRLDPASRRLVEWRFADGLDLAAIARRIRTSVATASRRLARLVQDLDACVRRQP